MNKTVTFTKLTGFSASNSDSPCTFSCPQGKKLPILFINLGSFYNDLIYITSLDNSLVPQSYLYILNHSMYMFN